jgi:lipid-binding SYLF domain-containing protein
VKLIIATAIATSVVLTPILAAENDVAKRLNDAAFVFSEGLALEGATLREDLDDDAVLYGKKLENRAIVTEGVHPPKAADRLLALLNRYSSVEHKH